eukprot:TRINITY_DN2633_c0_g2_i1.p1 TRINITY_DN2633_c0_g2~~TRINITY_DN2633_c0_g2_i1.p1  ORF type:complete len:372 (-),score=127.95 TRINITY_DN2633_c0_g2_i1:669-1784(-)
MSLNFDNCKNNPEVAKAIKFLASPIGVDIGGSFTKIVFFRPATATPPLPEYVIQEIEVSNILPFQCDPSVQILRKPKDGNIQEFLGFLKIPSANSQEFIEFCGETKILDRYGPGLKKLHITGGGAYKFEKLVQEKLKFYTEKLDEMQMLVKGLNFLLKNVENEVFTYSHIDKQQKFVNIDQNDLFPYLVVNIGSGVSILRVDSEAKFERVGGTSLGGGTFWGLCRLLTEVRDFNEVRRLSMEGNNTNVDLLVGDIYGSSYSAIGLRHDVIASSFGKVAINQDDKKANDCHPGDIIRSLLFMISNNIGQIGYLHGRLHGVKRIFFAGGFIQKNVYLWKCLSYAIDFWSKSEMEAMFLAHDGYLGALGTMLND